MVIESDTRSVQSSEAKTHFSALIEDVYNNGTRYVVKRFGKARAVIIPLSDFERLRQAEQQRDPAIREKRTVYKIGQPTTNEELENLLNSVV